MARQMNRVTPENPTAFTATAFTAGGPVPKSIIHAPTRAIHGRYSHRPSPERTSRESHQVRVRVFVCVRMCNARAHTCTHLTVIHTWEFRVQFQSVSPKHGQCVDAPRPAERQPLAQLKSIALAQRHHTLQSRHTQAALSALTAVD